MVEWTYRVEGPMKNQIAKILRVLAIIVFVLGGFISLLFMLQPDVMIVAMLATFVQGMMLLGFSEVIRLLQQIAEQTKSSN